MASVAGYSGPQFAGSVSSPTANLNDQSMYGSALGPNEDSFTYSNGQTGNEKKKSSFASKMLALAATIGIGVGGVFLVRGHLNSSALKKLGEQVKEGKLTEHLEFKHNPEKKGDIIFNKGAEVPKEHNRGINAYRKSFENADAKQFEKTLERMKLSDTAKKERLNSHIQHHNLVKAANPAEFKNTLNTMDAETFKNIYGVERNESKINALVAEHAHYHYGFNSNTKEYVDLLKTCNVDSAEIKKKGIEHAKKHHFFGTDIAPYKKALEEAGVSGNDLTEETIQHTFHHNISKDQGEFINALKQAGLKDNGRIKDAKIRHAHHHNIKTSDESAYLAKLKDAGLDLGNHDATLIYKQQHAIFHNASWADCENLPTIKDNDPDAMKTIHQAFYNSNGNASTFEKSFEVTTDEKKQQAISDWVQTFRRKHETST